MSTVDLQIPDNLNWKGGEDDIGRHIERRVHDGNVGEVYDRVA